MANTTKTKTISEFAATVATNNDCKNTTESIGDLLQQEQLKALTNACELLNKNCSKKKAVNVLIKSKTRSLLLKMIITFGTTAIIFYLLYSYYKIIFQSMRPSFSLRNILKLFSIDFWRSFLWLTIEVTIAVSRLSVVGKKTNSIVVDVLRITNSLLFLINKRLFSIEAFQQGAYYIESWLVYDVFHLIKTFYNDAIPEEKDDANPVSEKENVQFKQTDEVLHLYLLPIAESAAALYLALHVSETPAAIKARKNVQTIYSLLRILPIYLKANRNSVDALLAAHILIVLLDFWGCNFGKYSNNNVGKTGTNGQSDAHPGLKAGASGH